MLQTTTIAFIGGGNMATAMIQGLLKAGLPPARLRAADQDQQRCEFLADQYTITTSQDNKAVLTGTNVVIIAVKPNKVEAVLREIRQDITANMLVVSIAAGITMARLQASLPDDQPLVRVMPNTPALIGAGISALLPLATLSEEQRQLTRQIMAVSGDVVEVENEAMLDGVTALSGSGPAYLFLIAEALSDGGVACGLPRSLSDKLTIKTLIGAARLIDESGTHPAVLKNQVTSPGGTTIAGLKQLETAGVRGSLIAAVEAAWQRSRQLGNC